MMKILFTTLVLLVLSKELISAGSVPKFIKSQGYPVEEHFAVTQSGFILGLHRIPEGKKSKSDSKHESKSNGKNQTIAGSKPVVLLQHGFAESSACWVLSGKKSALGFKLADKGYDVWLANSRGTPYSFNHTKLNVTKQIKTFTSYSFYDQGLEDLPATIDYILNTTKRNNLTLYAHSEGAAVYYAMGARKPKYLGKINAFFGFAPLVFIGNASSTAVKIMATANRWYQASLLYDLLKPFINMFALPLFNILASNFLTKSLATMPISFISGTAPGQIDGGTMSRFVGHFPTYVSKRQMQHLLQLVNANAFQEYKYAFFNVKHLLPLRPKRINLRDNLVPTYLYFSGDDLFINPRNMEKYNRAFKRKPKIFNVHNGFGHYDFVYGVDAHKVYNLTYAMLDKHSSQKK